jgi:hypothetical protein
VGGLVKRRIGEVKFEWKVEKKAEKKKTKIEKKMNKLQVKLDKLHLPAFGQKIAAVAAHVTHRT